MANHRGDPRALGRRFWLLLGASGLSNLADGVFKVALPLVAVTFTRSPLLVAGLEVMRGTPWLLFALPAGAYTDRWNRRTTMVVANVVRAGLLVAATASVAFELGGLGVLFPIALGVGVAEVFHDTAAQTILPSVVDNGQLPRANSRLLFTEQTTQLFIGPPLAAALFGLGVGGALALGLPGVLWAVGAATLWTLRGSFRAATPSATTGTATRSIRAEIAVGIRVLVHHPVLWRWAAIGAVANLCIAATLSVLVLRALGDDTGPGLGLDERGYALLALAVAAGSVAGTIVVEAVLRRLGLARTVTLSLLALLALVAAPGLSNNPIIVWALLFIGGVGNTLFNVPTLSYRQEATPGELLGRVNSAFRFLAWGTIPVGAVVGGAIGELVSIRAVFLLVGALFSLVLLLDRSISDRLLAQHATPAAA